MRRGRIWRRRFTRAAATLGIGLLVGFLVPKVISDFTAAPETMSRSSESPVARQFITAYVSDDQATLNLLGIEAAVKSKAARIKAEYLKVDPPIHLGSWVIGNGATLHAYAADVVDNEGTNDQLAWRVITGAGAVQLIDPPPRVQTP